MSTSSETLSALQNAFVASAKALGAVRLRADFINYDTTSAVKLKACYIHLLRWGLSAEITNADKEKTTSAEGVSGFPLENLEAAREILATITKTIQTAREESKRRAVDSGAYPLAALESDDYQLQQIHSSLSTACKGFNEIIKQYERSLGAHDGVQADEDSDWAIYDETLLATFISNVSDHLKELAAMFSGLQTTEEDLASKEVEMLERDAAQVLLSIVADSDPALYRALKAAHEAQGRVFRGVSVGGKESVRLGS